MRNIKSEDAPAYVVPTGTENDDLIINRALGILEGRLRKPGVTLENPDAVGKYLSLRLAEEEREVFACLLLDNRHRLIQYVELFYGTIDGASVHPREVVKTVLSKNAAAVILAHNHPSGMPEPSRADINITKRLTDALALIDVRVLDHIIIGGGERVSFAERGLI